MCLLFTISLKKFQQNILETPLTAKVIVSIISSIKKCSFSFKKLSHNYISEDTPKCAKLHHLKIVFAGTCHRTP